VNVVLGQKARISIREGHRSGRTTTHSPLAHRASPSSLPTHPTAHSPHRTHPTTPPHLSQPLPAPCSNPSSSLPPPHAYASSPGVPSPKVVTTHLDPPPPTPPGVGQHHQCQALALLQPTVLTLTTTTLALSLITTTLALAL
jgi:hypothetical protein